MTVGVLAAAGDEQPTGPGLARVGDDRPVDDDALGVDAGRYGQCAPRHLRDLGQ